MMMFGTLLVALIGLIVTIVIALNQNKKEQTALLKGETVYFCRSPLNSRPLFKAAVAKSRDVTSILALF